MKIVRKFIALILFTMFALPPVLVIGTERCSVIQTDCCCKPEPVSCCDEKSEASKVNYHNPDCKCIITDANVVTEDNFLFIVKQQHNDCVIIPTKIFVKKIFEVNDNYSIISKDSFVIFQPKLYILNSSLLN